MIDTHAHLDMKAYNKDRHKVIQRAAAGRVEAIITIGIDTESSRSAIKIAHQYASIYAAVGCHPHEADGFDPQEMENLTHLAGDNYCVAWGEIGLDFFRLQSPKDNQLRVFQQQLERADSLNLPVVIHDRDAHEDVWRLLKRMGNGERKGVIHCFSGDKDLAMAFIELGYFISISGTVTYNKATVIKEVAAQIPLDRLLIETDAPFLAPVPRRGKRNEPLFVMYTAQEIARLRNISVQDLAAVTTQNAKILFGLP